MCQGVSQNAEILGLKNLQFLNMGMNSKPPDQAGIAHHKLEELLVEQHTVLGG
jgi:hypothetical protein